MQTSLFLKSKINIHILSLVILIVFFLINGCKSDTVEAHNISSGDRISGKIEGLDIINLDIDASGTYIVSGKYSSSSTGGKLLETMDVETSEKPDEIIVQLYPVYKSIGKDPIGHRVFSFQGHMPVENYYSKKLTLKISDTIKSLAKVE